MIRLRLTGTTGLSQNLVLGGIKGSIHFVKEFKFCVMIFCIVYGAQRLDYNLYNWEGGKLLLICINILEVLFNFQIKWQFFSSKMISILHNHVVLYHWKAYDDMIIYDLIILTLTHY